MDSPGPCPAQALNPSPGEVIQLYVHGSNGVNVTIGVNNGWIEGFFPNTSEIVEFHPISFNPSTQQINIAGVRAIPNDPPTGSIRLGSLVVNASDPNFSARVLAGGKGVAAGDATEDIDPGELPEPAQWLMLTAGSAMLTALARRRARLAKHRV
jgi:hypothetical protein